MEEIGAVHKEDTESNTGKQVCFQRRTALVEAEGIVNSRSITHVPNDAGDIEALTPNHFLLMRANPSYEDAEFGDREINSTKLW